MSGLVTFVRRFEHSWNVELPPVGACPAVPVLVVFMPSRRLPGLECSARRATRRGWRVALGKTHAHRRKSLDVRRLEVVTACGGVVGNDLQRRTHPALVIAHDDDEVGFVRRLCHRSFAAPSDTRKERSDSANHSARSILKCHRDSPISGPTCAGPEGFDSIERD